MKVFKRQFEMHHKVASSKQKHVLIPDQHKLRHCGRPVNHRHRHRHRCPRHRAFLIQGKRLFFVTFLYPQTSLTSHLEPHQSAYTYNTAHSLQPLLFLPSIPNFCSKQRHQNAHSNLAHCGLGNHFRGHRDLRPSIDRTPQLEYRLRQLGSQCYLPCICQVFICR